MSTNEDYIGREQSLVKHYILQHYLERFAHIIGSKWDKITYVDCFSGPWGAKSSDLSDTSFAIALAELRKARETHSELKTLDIRCLFLEENTKTHAELKRYAERQTDVTVETRNATMLESIPAILEFIREGGRNSFPFIFIDPTGGGGLNLDKIQTLLQHRPGEVLINFMTDFNRRFITPKETRAKIRECYGEELFGTDAIYDRVSKLSDPQDREDELFTFYASRVREVGKFDFTCPAVVLHPDVERTYFHLIYATRHRKGVEVFKKVEKDAFYFQESVRAEAEERKEPSLLAFCGTELPPSHRAVTLRLRYLAAAQARITEIRQARTHVPYDEIWDAAMAFPLVWDCDVKDWIEQWERQRIIQLHGLNPRQRVPQWEKGHVVEFLD